MTHALRQLVRRLAGAVPGGVLTLLLIEFYDELASTLAAVATPLIRDEYGLTYQQVGLLLGLPILISSLVEPIVLLLGDTPLRSRLIVGGGLLMAAAFVLAGRADSFALLVAALVLAGSSSGAFVSLSQAHLIGRHAAREAEMMARWTAAGTLGDLLGPATPAMAPAPASLRLAAGCLLRADRGLPGGCRRHDAGLGRPGGHLVVDRLSRRAGVPGRGAGEARRSKAGPPFRAGHIAGVPRLA